MTNIGQMVVGKAAILPQFPNDQQWLKMSCVGSSHGPPFRHNDSALGRIDALVKAYNQAKATGGSAGQKVYLLGELFLATVYWINNYMKDPHRMEAGRKVAIQSLNFTVTKELAGALACASGEVPARLLNIFGKGLDFHGVNVDKSDTSHYLDAAKRQQWRVIFQGGKAYRFADKTFSTNALVLLDTADYGKVMASAGDDERHAACGFALSMSEDLYVAPLLGKFGKGTLKGQFLERQKQEGRTTDLENAPVFHSSFMGGWPVLCAGMITVTAGMVTDLTNESGHYKPVDVDMVKVLQLLKAVGMDLHKTDIFGREGTTSAETFLRHNGDWKAIREAECQQVWTIYNNELKKDPNNKENALRFLVQERFNALKLSLGKGLSEQDLWKKAYQNICWDLAVYDPAWNERAKQPPIPRIPLPKRNAPPPPPKKGS